MKKQAVSAVIVMILAVTLAGCATSSRYALVVREKPEKSTVEIWHETSNNAEPVANYDSGAYTVIPIILPEDKPATRVVFAEKGKLARLAAGDLEYAGQLRTWLVDDHCFADLARRFQVWPAGY